MLMTNKIAKKIAAKISLVAVLVIGAVEGAEGQTMHASQSHYSTDDGLPILSRTTTDIYG